MALEKYIHGKHDDAHHDGLASNTRRLQAAEFHEQNWEEELLPTEGVIFDAGAENMKRHLDNRSRLHGFFYKGTYYHNGVGQPHKK